MKKSLYFAAVLIAFGLALNSDGFGQRPVLGGYRTIETTDEGAIAAADFAIKTQAEKAESSIELAQIVKAERATLNTRLCLQVSIDAGDATFVQTVVFYDTQTKSNKLTSWEAADCAPPDADGGRSSSKKAPAADGYKSIAKTDAGAGLAADFAVKTQSTKTKSNIKLGEIVKAEDEEMELGTKRNFRLCLKVSADGESSSFAKAIISMDAYSNLKLVSWTSSTCGSK